LCRAQCFASKRSTISTGDPLAEPARSRRGVADGNVRLLRKSTFFDGSSDPLSLPNEQPLLAMSAVRAKRSCGRDLITQFDRWSGVTSMDVFLLQSTESGTHSPRDEARDEEPPMPATVARPALVRERRASRSLRRQAERKSTVAGARNEMLESDDATLARALLEGDSRAGWVAWQRFAPKVRRTIRRFLWNETEIDDVVQQVFVCFLERLPTLQDPHALRAFLISITLNIARTEVRRDRLRRDVWRSGVAPPSSVQTDSEAREALARFCRIVGRMRPDDRSAFVQRFVENKDLVEVASRLGISLSTVKRRLNRIWLRIEAQAERDPALCSYLLGSSVGRSGPG
jgi:RNA polymerase sigma-70 factor (ECF subfamily)